MLSLPILWINAEYRCLKERLLAIMPLKYICFFNSPTFFKIFFCIQHTNLIMPWICISYKSKKKQYSWLKTLLILSILVKALLPTEGYSLSPKANGTSNRNSIFENNRKRTAKNWQLTTNNRKLTTENRKPISENQYPKTKIQ